MRRYLLIISSLIFAQSCVAQNDLDNVVIDNKVLSKCLTIKKNKIENYGNAIFLDAALDIKDNIGVCGCKSALLKYDVTLLDSGVSITHGLVSTLNKHQYKFVINTDNSIYKNKKFRLAVNCTY